MKNSKSLFLLSVLFVSNLICADDLPTGTPEDYANTIQDEPIACTWTKTSQWTINSQLNNEDRNKSIHTKAYLYHGGQWIDTDKATYLVERDPNNEFITFGVPDNLHNFDTIYLVFVSYIEKQVTGGNNLIKNHDFSQGVKDFTSDYKPVQDGRYGLNAEGYYLVGTGLRGNHSSANKCNGDHTDDSNELYFIANGDATSQGTTKIVWGQTITNTFSKDNYSLLGFSAYVQNWSATTTYAELQWYIHTSPLGEVQKADAPQCEWKRISAIWENDGTTDFLLSLRNNQTDRNGNDFGLDDLFFGPLDTKYSIHRLYIGEKMGIDTMTISLCPTLASTKEDLKTYLETELGTQITLEYENQTEAEDALKKGGKIVLKITTTKTNYPEPFSSSCENQNITSKIVIVNYSIDMEKEWKRSGPQQP